MHLRPLVVKLIKPTRNWSLLLLPHSWEWDRGNIIIHITLWFVDTSTNNSVQIIFYELLLTKEIQNQQTHLGWVDLIYPVTVLLPPPTSAPLRADLGIRVNPKPRALNSSLWMKSNFWHMCVSMDTAGGEEQKQMWVCVVYFSLERQEAKIYYNIAHG